MLNLLQALANTKLWERLQREDRLLQTGISADMINTSFNFRPTRPAAEIVDEYIRAIDYLYEPSKYLARTFRYFLAMRPTRASIARAERTGQTARQKKAPLPLKVRLEILPGLLRLLWRQGIMVHYRWQFWRQSVEIYRQNPSRWKAYWKKRPGINKLWLNMVYPAMYMSIEW